MKKNTDGIAAELGILDDIKKSSLEELKELKVFHQTILKYEEKRLAKKLGPGHPRVQKISNDIQKGTSLIDKIEIDIEVSKINVPEPPENGTLIHGRISDKRNRGISGLLVFAEDAKGNILRNFGNTETNASGYFAIQIDDNDLEKLKTNSAFLTVSLLNEDKVVFRANKSLALIENKDEVVNISLDLKDFSSNTVVEDKDGNENGDANIGNESENDSQNMDVSNLKGVGKRLADKLYEASIKTIYDFVNTSDEKLFELVSKASLTAIKKQNELLIKKVRDVVKQ